MKRSFALLLALLILNFTACINAEETVKVTITVTVPNETDEKATLHLAGSLTEVGDWKADGVKLSRQPDGTYKFQMNLPKGQTLEYKINGGDWDTVEKDDKGAEIENRTLKLDGDKDEKITVKNWAKNPSAGHTEAAQKSSTLTGDIRTHEHFASQILHNDRTVLVWLPPDYSTNQSARYPVLYLQDGQNCFDASTSFAGEWQADETATELIRTGKIKPLIIVAVANSGAGRIDEYTPTHDAERGRGGKGELYARFLIDEVKPFVDAHYRTLTDRENTAVAGSSLGGLISLYLGYAHGDVFSRCGVLSPSLMWDNQQLLKSIAADPKPLLREKIWFDIGTAEGPPEEAGTHVQHVQALAKILNSAGEAEGKEYSVRIIDGAQHNEKAWAARFGDVLTFLFPKS